MDEILLLYKKYNRPGAQKLLQLSRSEGIQATPKQIKEFLASRTEEQQLKESRNTKQSHGIWNPDQMYVPSTYRYVPSTGHVHRCYGMIPTCTAMYRHVPGTYQHVLLPQSMYWYVPGTYHLPLVHTGTY